MDPARKFVRLTLPPVHTEYLGRDLGVTEEHYRVSGLRSEITAGKRAALKEKMNKSLKDDIRNNPEYSSMLVKEAQAKARGSSSPSSSRLGLRLRNHLPRLIPPPLYIKRHNLLLNPILL